MLPVGPLTKMRSRERCSLICLSASTFEPVCRWPAGWERQIASMRSFWGGIHVNSLPNLYRFVPSIALCRAPDCFPSRVNRPVHDFSAHVGLVPDHDQECLVINWNN